jgi:hypothetical protein
MRARPSLRTPGREDENEDKAGQIEDAGEAGH